jgi:hypothetical protein
MSKLEIPTDNLYKFIAISGLSLIIFSIIALIAVITGPDKLIEASIKDAQKYLALVDKQIITKTPLTQTEVATLFSTEAEIKSYNEILEYRNANSIIVIRGLTILIVLGIGAVGFGFYCWYYKLQIHLDRQIANAEQGAAATE